MCHSFVGTASNVTEFILLLKNNGAYDAAEGNKKKHAVIVTTKQLIGT